MLIISSILSTLQYCVWIHDVDTFRVSALAVSGCTAIPLVASAQFALASQASIAMAWLRVSFRKVSCSKHEKGYNCSPREVVP